MGMFRVYSVGAALLLSGCATSSVVTSTPSNTSLSAEALGGRKAYLPYFLPQTVFVVTLKADAAGTDDKAAAGPTVSNTINIQNGTAKAEEAAKAKGGEDSKKGACVLLRETYDKARDAQITFVAGWGNDLATLDGLAAPDHPTAAQKKTARAGYAAVVAKLETANKSVDEALRIARIFNPLCPTKVSITVTTEVAPDVAHRYFLLIRDNDLSADKVVAKLDEQGLLTSVSTTADDKTAEVLTGAVKSIATVVGAVNPVDTGAITSSKLAAAAFQEPPIGAVAVAGPDPFVVALRAQIDTLRKLEPKPLPSLATPLPAHAIRYIPADLLNDAAASGGQALGESGYGLQLTCTGSVAAMTRSLATRQVGTARPPAATDPDDLSGALFSLPRACDVVVGKVAPADATDSGKYTEKQRSFAVVLDSRAPMSAPFERSRFVARTTSYEFKGGQLISMSYDKPSTAAAAWQLPGALVGSFFGGLVAGLQGPQSETKARADYIDAKANYYKSEAALIEAKTKADAARTAADKDKSTNSSPLT